MALRPDGAQYVSCIMHKKGYYAIMKILAIETSCDDSAIALIETEDEEIPSFRVLFNLVSSQTELHKKWGGIYPLLARREHQKNLPLLLKEILTEKGESEVKKEIAKILAREELIIPSLVELLKNHKRPKIDLIALTVGPGLDPSLWTGVNFAKALSYQWGIPIVPVNHIEAHLLVSLFSFKDDLLKFEARDDDFPAMGLIVSGGHTQLVLMSRPGSYEIVGETRDDAAGECFDKTARILGLGYPGGPAISAKAEGATGSVEPLPRPMLDQKNHDFSFSGLKTAVLYRHKKDPEKIKNDDHLRAESKEIQQAIIDVLISKTLSAAKEYGARSIVTGGGVISNKELRQQLAKKAKIKVFFPAEEGRTDNALMISVVGYQNRKKAVKYDKIKADPNLRL